MPKPSERPTVEALLTEATRQLAAAGVEEPRREARLLMAHASGLSRQQQMIEPGARINDVEGFRALVERRTTREPFAYITGRRGFWTLEFEVGEGILVPRPETETLIEAVLDHRPDRATPLRILDLGSGSGCIIVTLLHLYPNATGVAVDLFAAARECTRRNAERAGVADRLEVIESDWATAIDERFDLVASNPPYIRQDEMPDLAPEVRLFEPETALVAGSDGLDAYRIIASDLPGLLNKGGLAAVEIGAGQGDMVSEFMSDVGLAVIERRRDLAGIERCVVASG